MAPLLSLRNLSVEIDDKQILNNLNIDINPNEIHVVMGPNGVGKSTLSKVIMGSDECKIVSGEIIYQGKNINQMSVEERSRKGIFLAMQSPIEIEGVANSEFLKVALNSKSDKHIGLYDFIKKIEKAIDDLKMNENMIHRSINKGFSGGEKKKNEILQMKILEPKMIILDEIDSGLDVDSLKIVGQNIKDYYKHNNQQASLLIITHYPRLLKYIKPDFVHIMLDGQIVKTGDYKLASVIEKKGYDFVKEELK
ncbi:MAG: Fe-S cluster assembly ATPase SufC [Bacilli bacterium]|jgi:Fe-S cluster assembly ATP-binding protein